MRETLEQGDKMIVAEINFPRADIVKPLKVAPVACGRCNGRGRLEGYGHIHAGVCFRCAGNGVDPERNDWAYPRAWAQEQCAEHAAKEKAKKEKARARRDAKRQAERERAWNENVVRFPRIVEIENECKQAPDAPTFVVEMLFTANKYELTEKQGNALIDAYDKFVAFVAAAPEREAAKAEKQWIGEVGEKIEFVAEVKFVKEIETRYGYTLLVVFETEAGDVAKTFGTAEWLWKIETGDKVAVKGTVKELDRYDGVKQTILTRTKGELLEENTVT